MSAETQTPVPLEGPIGTRPLEELQMPGEKLTLNETARTGGRVGDSLEAGPTLKPPAQRGQFQDAAPPELPSEWTVLPPEPLPEPTIWPAALALGITFLVWGFVTSLIITGAGGLLFAVALAGWIRDIRHERTKP